MPSRHVSRRFHGNTLDRFALPLGDVFVPKRRTRNPSAPLGDVLQLMQGQSDPKTLEPSGYGLSEVFGKRRPTQIIIPGLSAPGLVRVPNGAAH